MPRAAHGPALTMFAIAIAVAACTPLSASTTVLAVVSDQSTTEHRTDALHPGTTYALQVQAVRATTLGSFVVGESQVATYTVP